MRLHRFRASQRLPLPIDETWRFFSDPANLALMTPPSLNLSPTSPLPSAMHPGMIVTYDVAPIAGVKIGWVTEITHVVEGTLFVDEQRAGPYRFWHHQHHFAAIPGGTEIEDIVHYALPGGWIGDVAGRRAVAARVSEIFAFRRHALELRFGQFTATVEAPCATADRRAAEPAPAPGQRPYTGVA